MLSFSGSLKVFVAVAPCDMRKGFNGLFAAVTERLDVTDHRESSGSNFRALVQERVQAIHSFSAIPD
jgi:hypothetical protein